jgi:hypothetical protein
MAWVAEKRTIAQHPPFLNCRDGSGGQNAGGGRTPALPVFNRGLGSDVHGFAHF